jgi:signal transduction histidine kinase
MSSSVPKQTKELPALLEIPAHRQDVREALIRSEKLASLGRMASTILHDINNPLAAAMNLLFLAQNDPNCPMSVRQDLSKAESELQRILQNARQVLGSHRDAAAPSKISLSTTMEEALGPFETRIMAKGVEVDKRYCEESRIVSIAGDVRQVFSNLISNSLDAVGESGRMKVRIAQCSANGNRMARITIADNGTGIDASALPRIFEPLFTTKESVGTGLGLWAAKQLVEKLGGSIRFRSTARPERRGTTFVIDLPAVLADQRSGT